MSRRCVHPHCTAHTLAEAANPAARAEQPGRARWNRIVWFGWLALFLALEIPAVRDLTPWTSLSEYCWSIEDETPVARWTFMGGLAVLLTHIVARWPR